MLLRYVSLLLLLGSSTIYAQQEEPTKQQITNLNDPIVCDCGYIDENNNLWGDIWHANYGNYKSSLQYDHHYLVMDYTVNAKHNNTLDRIFSPNNVQLSKENGITLSVQKDSAGRYTSAAVGTKRNDFLYGTFRARIKTSQIAGTVAAFFFYRNDTCEIDMESLSRFTDPYKTYFAIQPQVYNPDGSASPVTNEKHALPFNPTQDFHEYRFDWTPGSVKFYIDGIMTREMTTNVPNSPGRVILNHWTDGNPNFSGGPPGQNSDLLVSHLNLFFNSSESESPPPCQKSKTPCKVSGKEANVVRAITEKVPRVLTPTNNLDIMNRNLLPGTEVISNSSFVMPSYSHSIMLIFGCLLFYFHM